MTRWLGWFSRLDRAELGGALVLALVVFTLAALPLGATLRYSPADIESGRVVLTPPCPYHARTGKPCPTCGMTRGVAAANRLRFSQAWAYNPWSVPAAGLLWLAVAGSLALGAASAKRLRLPRARPRWYA